MIGSFVCVLHTLILGVAKYGVCRAALQVLSKLVVILKGRCLFKNFDIALVSSLVDAQCHFQESPPLQGLRQALSTVRDPQDKELVVELLKYLQ